MFDHLLLATDSSPEAQRAVTAAQELAKLAGSEVRVVHVREGAGASRTGVAWQETHEEAVALVDETVEALRAEGVTATGVVRASISGHVAREILDEAEESHASTIVMGTRGLSDLGGIVIGSTAHKVLHLGKIPVLVIR